MTTTAAGVGTDDEIADLLAALAEVARDVIPHDPAGLRAHRDGPDGYDRELWRRFGHLGWLSLLVAENRGGAGADERAAAVVARALGSAGRLEPFVAAGVIVPIWLAGLDGPAAANLLDPVMAGEVIVAPAWQSAGGGPDATSLAITAAVTSRGIVLDGTAHWVPLHRPDTFVVAAHVAGETTGTDTVLVRVEAGMPGVTVHSQPMADGTLWARLELTAVQLPTAALLGRGEPAATAVARGADTAAIVVAAELLGSIERMLELTVEYLGSRRQFGRPIGTFQALQHKCVDMWVQQRLTEAALTEALRRRSGAGPLTRALMASSAKARASGAALQVGGQAVQLHGAIGFTDEYELAHLVNRALVLAAWLGNAATHTRRYARLLAQHQEER